jgi:hypothetical protein
MGTIDLGEVIAERTFVFAAKAGWSRDVFVKLGRPAPEPQSGGRAWVCPYQISGIERDRVMGIFGVDAMQALLLAIHTIPIDLAVFGRQNAGVRSLRSSRRDVSLGV